MSHVTVRHHRLLVCAIQPACTVVSIHVRRQAQLPYANKPSKSDNSVQLSYTHFRCCSMRQRTWYGRLLILVAIIINSNRRTYTLCMRVMVSPFNMIRPSCLRSSLFMSTCTTHHIIAPSVTTAFTSIQRNYSSVIILHTKQYHT